MPQLLLIFVLYLGIMPLANADGISGDENVMRSSCHITPYYDDLQPMPEFANTNNLRRRAGTVDFAEGQPVILRGRILDFNCVPVAGAIINIWQANAEGIHEFVSADYNQHADDFGTGTAVTDNLGNFHFITIFPGAYNKRAPHLNVRVRHANFLPFVTQMFFADQLKNAADPVFSEMKAHADEKYFTASLISNKENVDFLTYMFDIILEGQGKYVTY